MAEFRAFCEMIESAAAQAALLETGDADTRAMHWAPFDAAVQHLVEKAGRFEARARETDPDKRVYGPGMASKVFDQVARVTELARVHAAVADTASREAAEKRAADERARQAAESAHFAAEALRAAEAQRTAEAALAEALRQKAAEERQAAEAKALAQALRDAAAAAKASALHGEGVGTKSPTRAPDEVATATQGPSPAPALTESRAVATPEEDAATGGQTAAWHCWRHPDVPIRSVLAIGIYAVPADAAEHDGWQVLCSSLMDSCRAFHEREFPGSKLSTAVCGPLVLPCESTSFAGDAEKFYELCLEQVKTLAKSGPFPEVVVSHSAEETLRAVDVIVFTVFTDWGQEPAAGNLQKYYLVKPAAKAGVDLSDISRTGGSRSAFYGRVPATDFSALSEVASQCSLGLGHTGCISTDRVSSASMTVAYGLGLVTQEAWRHPEVNGSDSVTYHEGLGHALAMPHPQERQATCVMDLGQYQDLPLMQLHICPEIKADMVSEPICTVVSALLASAADVISAGIGIADVDADIPVARELHIVTALPRVLVPFNDHPESGSDPLSTAAAVRILSAHHRCSQHLFMLDGPGDSGSASAASDSVRPFDVLELGWVVTGSDGGGSACIIYRSQPVVIPRARTATGSGADASGSNRVPGPPPLPPLSLRDPQTTGSSTGAVPAGPSESESAESSSTKQTQFLRGSSSLSRTGALANHALTQAASASDASSQTVPGGSLSAAAADARAAPRADGVAHDFDAEDTAPEFGFKFLPRSTDIPRIVAALGDARVLPPPLFVPAPRPVKPSTAAPTGSEATAQPHTIHGRLPGEAFALGAEWTELQLARVPSGVPGVAALTESATYAFKEVRWLTKSRLSEEAGAAAVGGAASAEAPPSPFLLLLDAGRNIALAIPAGREETCRALFSSAGVHGEFSPFNEGAWCTRRFAGRARL